MKEKELKVLFITPSLDRNSGGGVLTESIKRGLKQSFNTEIWEVEQPKDFKSRICNLLKGQLIDIDKYQKHKYIKRIKDNEFDIIVFNHAYFGGVARLIKRLNSSVKVYLIGHNVEYYFAYDKFKIKKSISSFLGWMLSYHSEKLTIRNTDFLIALNNRDSNNFYKRYKRKADLILPIGLKDIVETGLNEYRDTKYGLFVGSAFYANVEGISWFKENVSPFINMPIYVVGRGFEKYKEELSDSHINVIGSVNDLNEYYHNASFVISPILSGSGMKTKTAEAMMFGKYIIASDEALEGYMYNDNFVKKCNSAAEFIDAINSYKGVKYIEDSRNMYLKYYSQKALILKFNSFILNH